MNSNRGSEVQASQAKKLKEFQMAPIPEEDLSVSRSSNMEPKPSVMNRGTSRHTVMEDRNT